MDVHRNLGAGFLEIVYKDALELEFRNAGIEFERERRYEVNYKGIILPHKFYADFVVYDDNQTKKGIANAQWVAAGSNKNYD